MDAPESFPDSYGLSGAEAVLHHQFNIRAYWTSKQDLGAEEPEFLPVCGESGIPEKWALTQGIELRDWQIECAERWFQAGSRGVVKVVTGAGKTVFAIALVEKLQNTREPDLRVAVVVPTVVLMEQWRSSILKSSNFPASAVGCLGGGSQDSLTGDVRILIAVINSASSKLPGMGRDLTAPAARNLLLG